MCTIVLTRSDSVRPLLELYAAILIRLLARSSSSSRPLGANELRSDISTLYYARMNLVPYAVIIGDMYIDCSEFACVYVVHVHGVHDDDRAQIEIACKHSDARSESSSCSSNSNASAWDLRDRVGERHWLTQMFRVHMHINTIRTFC